MFKIKRKVNIERMINLNPLFKFFISLIIKLKDLVKIKNGKTIKILLLKRDKDNNDMIQKQEPSKILSLLLYFNNPVNKITIAKHPNTSVEGFTEYMRM